MSIEPAERSKPLRTRLVGAAALVAMVLAVLGFSAFGGADGGSADRPASTAPIQPPAAPTPLAESQRAARALAAEPLRDVALVPSGWVVADAHDGRGQVRLTRTGPSGDELDLLLSAEQVGSDWVAFAGGDGSRRVALDTVPIPVGRDARADAVVGTAVGRTFITVPLVDGWLLTMQMPLGADRAAALDLAAQILAPIN